MTKSKAINLYGIKVIDKARDLYETDFGKVLFPEDCQYDEDISPDEEERLEYIGKAHYILSQEFKSKK